MLLAGGIGGLALRIESADIADAHARGVVTFGVCPHLVERTSTVDGAFLVDDIVVANVTEVAIMENRLRMKQLLAVLIGNTRQTTFNQYTHRSKILKLHINTCLS